MDIIAKDIMLKRASLKKALLRVETALSHKKRRPGFKTTSLHLARQKLLLSLECLKIAETVIGMAHIEAHDASRHMAEGIRTYTKRAPKVYFNEPKAAEKSAVKKVSAKKVKTATKKPAEAAPAAKAA